MGHEVELLCLVPRCGCPEHGIVQVAVPWAEPGSRFTVDFEAMAVEVITASRSLSQAAELLRLDWDSVQRILERAVERGLARRSTEGVRYVGLDEKSFGRGQRYVSIATDIQAARVLEVVPGNDQAAGESLWQALPEDQRGKVEAATMDMSAGFVAATRVQAPQAAIVHDKFHVAKLLNDAVDQTRRAEHQQLQAEGDDTLKNTRYLWLHGQLPEAKQAAASLGLQGICTNPYMNTVAQVVEIVQSFHESLAIVDEFIKKGIKDEPLSKPTKFGKGAGATEVPRGILFHEYEYDKDGMCLSGNCIIPTNQNHANIQKDFEALVPQLLKEDADEKKMELRLEMLVRAYDPCISCSTHFLDVKFIR